MRTSRRGVWLPPDSPCTIIHKSTYKRKKCTNERKCTIKTVNLPSLTNHLEFPLIFTSYSSQALNLVYALSQWHLLSLCRPAGYRLNRKRFSSELGCCPIGKRVHRRLDLAALIFAVASKVVKENRQACSGARQWSMMRVLPTVSMGKGTFV
jgi:hypothetical protein